MERYMTNKEEVQFLRRWWDNYGKGILIAVLIGLSIGYGWRYWQSYKNDQAMSASIIYQDFILSVQTNNNKQSQEALGALHAQYSGSIFTQLAQLQSAQTLSTKHAYTAALSALDYVQVHTKVNSLKAIALLRKASIYRVTRKYQLALSQLSQVKSESFALMMHFERAQVYQAMGNTVNAAKELQKILKNPDWKQDKYLHLLLGQPQ